MATQVSVIGRTTRVSGRVTGTGDLEVNGFVEGDVEVGGDLTVEAQGIVGAGVRGHRVVVRGAVKGDVIGQESISLEDGARVVGDLRAPRIFVAQGALVRGFIDTGDQEAPPVRATRSQAGVRAGPTVATRLAVTPAAPRVAPLASASNASSAAIKATLARPVPESGPNSNNSTHNTNSTNNNVPPARRPPPPVVPALKKAKGQIAKRKER